MNENLIARITRLMPTFSKGQRRIATFILEHSDQAAYMTAAKLGETVEVSESTVVRFAAVLGFEGYPDMQRAIRELIRSKLTTSQRIAVTRSNIANGNVLTSILSYDMANIRQTMEELPQDVFEQAVEAILSASRLYILGAGSCEALARFAAYYLKLMLPDARLINSTSDAGIIEDIIHIQENDIVLGISFPRYSAKTAKTLQYARNRKAKVIAITDSALSPIAELADYLLLAHSDMPTIVDSLVAPLSLINALVVAVSLKRLEGNQSLVEELEDLQENYHIYHPFL